MLHMGQRTSKGHGLRLKTKSALSRRQTNDLDCLFRIFFKIDRNICRIPCYGNIALLLPRRCQRQFNLIVFAIKLYLPRSFAEYASVGSGNGCDRFVGHHAAAKPIASLLSRAYVSAASIASMPVDVKSMSNGSFLCRATKENRRLKETNSSTMPGY